jgi:hypothetical protein
MLEELLLREEDFVEHAQLLGLSSDNEDWWTDTDEYDGTEIRASSRKMRYQGKIVQGQAMEDCVTEEPDLLAAIMDGFHGDIIQQAEKRTFNQQEQKKAFEILSKRER